MEVASTLLGTGSVVRVDHNHYDSRADNFHVSTLSKQVDGDTCGYRTTHFVGFQDDE